MTVSDDVRKPFNKITGFLFSVQNFYMQYVKTYSLRHKGELLEKDCAYF